MVILHEEVAVKIFHSKAQRKPNVYFYANFTKFRFLDPIDVFSKGFMYLFGYVVVTSAVVWCKVSLYFFDVLVFKNYVLTRSAVSESEVTNGRHPKRRGHFRGRAL